MSARTNVDRARRAYRRLLRLTPRLLRQRHSPEMEELFAEMLVEARGRGGRSAALAVWLCAVVDVLRTRTPGPSRAHSTLVQPRMSGRGMMLSTNLRYALRSFTRQKLSTSLVIAMLSLGIGANVVVFSLINGLFLRPFPFSEPDRLVYVNSKAPRWNLDEHVGINYPDFHQWRQSVKLFEGIALSKGDSFNMATGTRAERITGSRVTWDFADVLRVRPVIGRLFTPDEDRPNGPAVVLIGYALWQERFDGAPGVLGKRLRLDSVPHTIVGVLPPEGEWQESRLWVPLQGDPNQQGQSYSGGGIGRLSPGASMEAAQRDLLRAHEPIWETRDRERIVSPYIKPLREELSGSFRTMASTLGVAVALLLLVACANVASVMLARALARRREMGLRLAVGAGRARLLQQLFVENLVLAIVGGALGLALGFWALRGLLAAAGDQVPRWTTFELDWRIVLFAVALSGLTTLLFGCAPALHAIRGNLWAAMRDAGGGSTTAPGGRRTLSWLVGAEFALASVLIICGGLLLRAYAQVRNVDPGFRTERILTFGLDLPEASYPDDAKRLAFWERLSSRLERLPGVQMAGLVTCAPLGCHWGVLLDAEGQPPRRPGEQNPVVLIRLASASYFQAMGIRLKSGRFFDERDARDGRPRGVVVNETLAKTFFPNVSDPVGRRLRSGDEEDPWLTVVGVAHDVKHYGLEEPMRPGLYAPLPMNPATNLTVVLRTAGNPTSIAESARRAVRELDTDLAPFQVRTMEEALNQSLVERQSYSVLLVAFATLALLLALGGIYGVASYFVTQRTREIGIRLALGARARDITRTLLGSSLGPVVVGTVLGVAAAIGCARLLADLLFGVSPHDAAIMAAGVALLIPTALAANWLPARRAARIDPKELLRIE
ncbi:MAG: FtsX-like permease family protein [Luteitalea sp.]|nr:FtsX-like permease family protein [Luteitalea sp.]